MPRGIAVARGIRTGGGIATTRSIATARSIVNPLASVPWIAQWKFNNNGNDSIGANTLTNNGVATFTDGKLGGATGATQLVAASNQYWSIVSNSALQAGDVDFTILAWVYLDDKTTYRTLVAKENAGDTEYTLYYSSAVSRFQFYAKRGGSYPTVDANSLGLPSTGVWYCIIAWHDSVADTLNIQVNDGVVDSMATGGALNAATAVAFYIGGRAVAGSLLPMDGRIDNVAFAKSAAGGGGVLSAAQRTAFYNGGVGIEQLT